MLIIAKSLVDPPALLSVSNEDIQDSNPPPPTIDI